MLRWLLLGLLLLATALLGALWWANRHDDPLRPEVAALLKFEPPTPEAMQRNGYFTLLGLGAPEGEDALEAGKRCFAVQMQAYERLVQTGAPDYSTHDVCRAPSLPLSPISCNAAHGDCAAHYAQHTNAIRKALEQHRQLLERYQSLSALPEYAEVIPPDFSNVPAYRLIVVASELLGMQATLLLDNGQTQEAMDLLTQNARLHERLMSGSRTIIGAMVVLAMEMRQQRLVSALVHRHPGMTQSDPAELDDALGGVSINPVPAFEGEARFTVAASGHIAITRLATNQASLIDRAIGYAAWPFFRISYLPHATLNALYWDRLAIVDLVKTPADQLDVRADETLREHARAIEGPGISPFPLRNFWGSVLRATAGPHILIPYIERTHDVEAHRRLVRLQIAALRERVPPEQMPTWLAAQPPALRNPYTLQAMGWDPATQSLVFEGRQHNSQNPEPRHVYRVPLAAP